MAVYVLSKAIWSLLILTLSLFCFFLFFSFHIPSQAGLHRQGFGFELGDRMREAVYIKSLDAFFKCQEAWRK